VYPRIWNPLESTLGSASGRLVILVTSPVLGSYLPHVVAASYADMSSCLMAESCWLHYSIPQASHSWPAQIYCCKIQLTNFEPASTCWVHHGLLPAKPPTS
jgi:hypothetical protein